MSVRERIRKPMVPLGQYHAIAGNDSREIERVPVPGTPGEKPVDELSRRLQAGLSFGTLTEVGFHRDALNAANTPVSLTDLECQVQVSPGRLSQARQVFQRIRDKALSCRHGARKVAYGFVEVENLV